MALEAPLRSSTGSIISSYSPLGDMSSVSSPESPAIHPQYMAMYILPHPPKHCSGAQPLTYDPRSSASSDSQSQSQSLRPNWPIRPQSAHLMSPGSDLVGPSPVTSNGTETTDIDDEIQEEENARQESNQAHQSQVRRRPYLPCPPKLIFDTNLLIAYDATDQYPRPRPQKLERRGRLRDTRPTEFPKLGTVIDRF